MSIVFRSLSFLTNPPPPTFQTHSHPPSSPSPYHFHLSSTFSLLPNPLLIISFSSQYHPLFCYPILPHHYLSPTLLIPFLFQSLPTCLFSAINSALLSHPLISPLLPWIYLPTSPPYFFFPILSSLPSPLPPQSLSPPSLPPLPGLYGIHRIVKTNSSHKTELCLITLSFNQRFTLNYVNPLQVHSHAVVSFSISPLNMASKRIMKPPGDVGSLLVFQVAEVMPTHDQPWNAIRKTSFMQIKMFTFNFT